MELRALRYFVVVAEELHFRRAAERLFVSQPPISQQIRALEKELGAKLFTRTTRKVALTESGRVFLENARKILDDVDSAASAVQRVEEGEHGRLAIGFIRSTAYTLLPGILKRCRETLPGLELRLQELSVDHQMDALLDRKIDAGIVRMPVPSPRVEAQLILKEKLVLAIPSGSALLNLRTIPLPRLAQETMIGYPTQDGEGSLHATVSTMCRRAGFVPRFAQVAATMHTALGLVRAGVGVALLPSSTQVMSLSGVEYRPVTDTSARVMLGLAVRKGEASALVKAFSKVVLKSVRELRLTQP